jgi:ferredoxin--NADP+ reductase
MHGSHFTQEDRMPRTVTYNATLEKRTDLTDALTIFRFRMDAALPEAPWFVPGQYCVIGLNNTDRPELGAVQRRMSIASSCWDRSGIEFYIRYVAHPTSDNPLTHLLWKLSVGDRAFVRAIPKGRFTITHLVGDADPRLKLCVAAGTGLAPFVAIVRSHLDAHPGTPLHRFAILHAASYPEDLGYRQELEEWTRHGLLYLPTISRPHLRPDWQGTSGRVEDLFLADHLAATERHLGLEAGFLRPANVAVFVCGLQGTIGRCIERLAPRGFVPDQRRLRAALGVPEEQPSSLFFEQYDTAPVIDLTDPANVARIAGALRAAC